MKYQRVMKAFLILMLLGVMAFGAIPVARAFDGRGGDTVTIGETEVVQDDLYISANLITLNGTIQGDVLAFGATIVIGPKAVIEGSFLGAGRLVELNGTVRKSARMAGMVVKVGENARVEQDLVVGGYSLETAAGSAVQRDLVMGGMQALLAGSVAHDVLLGVSALDLQGTFQGNVYADIGDGQAPPVNFLQFIPDTPAMPGVAEGLKLGKNAKIGGKLEYVSQQEMSVGPGQVQGGVTHLLPKVDLEAQERAQAAAAQAPLNWFLKLLRSMATLVLVALGIAWLFPGVMRSGGSVLEDKPLKSLGWGLATIFITFFGILLLIGVMLLLAIIFAVVSLGDLSGSIVMVGMLIIFAVIVAFSLAVSYLAYIVVGDVIGRWILGRIRPALADNRFWPVILGVLLLAILAAIPVLGAVVVLLTVLFGLGSLWLAGQAWRRKILAPAIAAS